MEEKTAVPELHIRNYRTYVYVWLALLVLLAATIYVARVNFTGYSVVINLIIATMKAALVLAFFMHLKYEKRLFKLLLFVPILTISVIIGLTFFDIWYR